MLESILNNINKLNSLGAFGFFATALIAYFYYSRILYPYYLSPLRNLPRPRNALWHYITYVRHLFAGDVSISMKLSLEHGPIVHLRDKRVLINGPNVRKLFMTYKFPKVSNYQALNINGPNLFSATDRNFHVSVKKLISPAFNNKSLADMEHTIYKVGSESLVQYLDSFLDNEANREFDLFHVFHCNTLDVISELVFGKTLNTTWDEKKGIYYIKELAKSQYMLFLRVLIPFYKHVKLPMERLFKPVIMNNIKNRKFSNLVHNDILQSMINAEDPETGDKLSDLRIADECMVILFGGMDTTAASLTWVLYEIVKNLEVYKLVANEILEKFPNLNEPISYDEAKNELKYLGAAIMEAMRIHPVAAGLIPREVPEGGITINGHYLPPKTEIAIDVYTQHNDPTFWKNPREFDINRWLGPDASINKNQLLRFGLGTRSCLGRELAIMEIYLVLANMIRHFNFELIDKELTPTYKLFYKPKNKRFMVNISRRV